MGTPEHQNPRVPELARQAAKVTGKSQTGAIEDALERLLEAYDADPNAAAIALKVDRVRSLVSAYVSDQGRGDREITTVDDLYDAASGLPR